MKLRLDEYEPPEAELSEEEPENTERDPVTGYPVHPYAWSQEAIEKRREAVLRLDLMGHSRSEIAELLGVSGRTIQRDLATLTEERKARRLDNYGPSLNREIDKLHLLERMAHDGWKQSQEDAVTKTIEETPDGRKVRIQTTGQQGNPAFINALLQIIKYRCALTALEQPQEIHHRVTVEPGKPIDQYSDDELTRLYPVQALPLPDSAGDDPDAGGQERSDPPSPNGEKEPA